MSLPWFMLGAGFLLLIAGWKNISYVEALRGNFDVAKPATGSTPGVGVGTGSSGTPAAAGGGG